MILEMSGTLAIIIDVVAWLLFHISGSVLAFLIPANRFNPESILFKEHIWEKNGGIYARLFKIKFWKEFLPDGAVIFKKGFRKKRLRSRNPEYIKLFILETCRAELTHLVIFFCGFLFFIWNTWWIGVIMIIYAAIVNLPCIITQRYNRARLKRLHSRLEARL